MSTRAQATATAYTEAIDQFRGSMEATRGELVTALQDVATKLSNGLKGDKRTDFQVSKDLSQNAWFFAGTSGKPGNFAVTMWPSKGETTMMRIDIGDEDAVHELAQDMTAIEATTDSFIVALTEDYISKLQGTPTATRVP
ncbi:MAG TPA: hypothetical protein VM409_01040 [Chloroflexia bacterium]|nr:hypothetical protein [Chloroflexia bacterium]